MNNSVYPNLLREIAKELEQTPARFRVTAPDILRQSAAELEKAQQNQSNFEDK